MDILVVKLGATGDVVRTTTLLRCLKGDISWITEAKNTSLLEGLSQNVCCLTWAERDSCLDRSYDLVVNLEDTVDVARYLSTVNCSQLWGAYLGPNDEVVYTDDSRCWFDLSIISRYGRHRADELKLANRATYQQLIFRGLGLPFLGEAYLLPKTPRSPLVGDVAIASEAGPVWPMKKWAYFSELQQELETAGLVVNILPTRPTLLEHLADVRGHRCLVSGDSLPMHFALGSGVRCVSIFTCTSPWEIYEYGIQRKVISPLLEEFFYKRTYDRRATTAVSIDEVVSATLGQLNHATQVAR